MLKGIPPVLSPELLKVLAEMGHGDTLTIGDANFASAAFAKNGILVRADGHSSAAMLDAILSLFPLDTFADSAVTVMGVPKEGCGLSILEMSDQLLQVVQKYDENAAKNAEIVDRFAFYERAEKSYAVLATGEANHYGCIIIQKGVL